jgi:hypothetical protein
MHRTPNRKQGRHDCALCHTGKNGGGRRAAVVKVQHRAPAILHHNIDRRMRRLSGAGGPAGQKKARCGSGLNLSLEENRGDSFIMLHRKKEIQFSFPMSLIDFINDSAVNAPIVPLLVHKRKCSTIAKCLKTLCCRSRSSELIQSHAARCHCRPYPAIMPLAAAGQARRRVY